MKSILDRLEEFAELNEVKTEMSGSLPSDLEARWRQLKGFYDRLMRQSPSERGSVARRFLIDAIRRRLKRRERLRVRADMDFFFRYQDTYLSARLVNLSTGGLFFASRTLLDKGSRIKLYLPNLGTGYQALFETRGEVVWAAKGDNGTGLPRGIGARFLDVKPAAAAELDAFVVESLERRLPAGLVQGLLPQAAGRECFYFQSK